MNNVLDPDAANGAPSAYGDAVYKQCPQCGTPIKLAPMPQNDNIKGTLWSDGYLENPDLPEPSILGKCRACGAIGCLAELPVMEVPPQPAPGVNHNFVALTVDDYAVLLENLQDISLQFHAYLRLRFWQLNNHRRRNSDEPPPLSDVERANLHELLNLLGDADTDRLFTAEILRQLQEFEAAQAVLAGAFNAQVGPIARRLWELARDRKAELVKIHTVEP